MIRILIRIILGLLLALALLWAAAALYIDFPNHSIGTALALAVPIVVIFALLKLRRTQVLGVCVAIFALVLSWWLTLAPSNDRPWLRDVAQTPWAEQHGEMVTIHNFRNFDYVTETDYKPNWETRTVDLSKIRGVDLFINYWGSPAIAHTILSFDFADSLPVAISIETRKTVGQEYSAVLGFFRQFALIYIVGDERDIVRVRTNYRKGEDLYLYHTHASPERARVIFLDYLKSANELRDHPQWYNALTSNCTTDVVPHVEAADKTAGLSTKVPWDYRILLNGYIDRMLYEQGRFAGNLPFDELKSRAHINPAAKAADQSPDFSHLIRVNRPGFN
jgi:hypothetical protein